LTYKVKETLVLRDCEIIGSNITYLLLKKANGLHSLNIKIG